MNDSENLQLISKNGLKLFARSIVTFLAGIEPNRGVYSDTDMRNVDIQKFCNLNDEYPNLMRVTIQLIHLSAQTYHRITKVGRKIVRLANS